LLDFTRLDFIPELSDFKGKKSCNQINSFSGNKTDVRLVYQFEHVRRRRVPFASREPAPPYNFTFAPGAITVSAGTTVHSEKSITAARYAGLSVSAAKMQKRQSDQSRAGAH